MAKRIRRLVLARLLRGDLRRWAIYLSVSWLWRRYRKLTGKVPELVYSARLPRGAQLSMATSKPLPAKLPHKKVRAALQAAADHDVAEINASAATR